MPFLFLALFIDYCILLLYSVGFIGHLRVAKFQSEPMAEIPDIWNAPLDGVFFYESR